MFRPDKRIVLLRSINKGALVCVLTLVSMVAARAMFQSFEKKSPLSASATSPQSAATAGLKAGFPNQNKVRPKKLRELALERDVEVEGTSGSDVAHSTLASLCKESSAILMGRITATKSFFDESGDPTLEYGEIITTEYSVQVLRVFKNTTLETMPPSNMLAPAALATPVKIARNGGVVFVNGHKAAVNVKGYEALIPEREYVFFMNWSPDYQAYVLTFGILGAVAVDASKTLRPLASSEEMRSSFRNLDLDSLAAEINR